MFVRNCTACLPEVFLSASPLDSVPDAARQLEFLIPLANKGLTIRTIRPIVSFPHSRYDSFLLPATFGSRVTYINWVGLRDSTYPSSTIQ